MDSQHPPPLGVLHHREPPGGATPCVSTLQSDTLQSDTSRRNTLPRDTLQSDTLRRNTLPRDTLRRNTTRRDSVPGDTVPDDSVQDGDVPEVLLDGAAPVRPHAAMPERHLEQGAAQRASPSI